MSDCTTHNDTTSNNQFSPPLKKPKISAVSVSENIILPSDLKAGENNHQEQTSSSVPSKMVSSSGSATPVGAGSTENGEVNGSAKNTGDFDTNLYSRQLYTFGEAAMRRLRCARVLISGLGGIGVEIAKNLVLSGVRHVTIHDTKSATYFDLSSQYYLNEKSVGTNRATACYQALAELNDSVTVDCNTQPLEKEFVERFDVVVLTNYMLSEQLKINHWTRQAGKKFIAADTFGLVGVIFNDFHDKHVIEDATGEDCVEVYIEHVDKVTGDVTCLEEIRHNMSDGDYVTFSEVKGMTELNNCTPRKIRVINPVKFNIGDCSGFSDYKECGKVRQVKMPVTVSHKSLESSLEAPEFLTSDFAKLERPSQFHIFLQALHLFRQQQGDSLPAPHNQDDADQVFALAEQLNLKTNAKVDKLDKKLCDLLCYGAIGSLCPMTSFIGGMAAQEAVKAVTAKYTPIKQWMYFDAFECLPDQDSPFKDITAAKCAPKRCRYDGQAAVFGWDYQEAVAKQNWFLVGAGAIGCELLKNFSMIGLGCSKNGSVTVTDMDQIEISNLNRQFLFRRHNVGSKKSTAAAQAAKYFNPNFNVVAMCERVGADTEEIFDDKFFGKLHGVANALDNVEARTYMDRRCVYYRKPLLETGTLGPKGNTQVIYPFLTESYSSSQDPPEKSIPICTVKHFPNQIEHTIQWARELFTGLFTNPAETANQFIEDPRLFNERIDKMHTGQKYDMLNTVKKVLIDDRPANVDQCIGWARRLLDESFDWDIRQLLHNFPADQLTSHGVKFWSGAKRCPHPLTFDPANQEHVDFVLSAAYLRAQMYGITPTEDAAYVAKVAAAVRLPPFEPKSGVRIAINDAELQQQANDSGCDNLRLQELNLALAKLKLNTSSRLSPIDFEKDDDTNHHVEFITCASNLRAGNYSIPKADKLKTKQIAGRIIPAIATTTAAVAGLDCIELYKIIMGDGKCKLETFKNGFIELALPFLGFAEPVRAPKKKYYENEWTLWDRFEIRGEMTLKELMDHMMKEHKLEVSMLSQGVCILYSFFMDPKKREQRLNMTIGELVKSTSGKALPSYVKYLVLEPMCSDDKGEDVDVPYVNYEIA